MKSSDSIFGKPHHDVSYNVAPLVDGSYQIIAFEYSSIIMPVWVAEDLASLEFFVNRFALCLDTWHDVYNPGWTFEANIEHRVGNTVGEDTISSHVKFQFVGWLAETDISEGENVASDMRLVCQTIDEAVSKANA